MNYTFLLLFPYTVWCVVFFFPNILTPRKAISRPRLTILLLCIFILPFIITLPSKLAVLRNVSLQCFYIIICILFFQESLLKKLSCYLMFQLTGTVIEIVSGNIFLVIRGLLYGTGMSAIMLSEITAFSDIILMTSLNMIIGIYFYYNEVKLLKRCLSYLRLSTFVQILLPILVPILAQGIMLQQTATKAFLMRAALYWFLCLITVFIFQKGIQKIRQQEKQHLIKTRNMNLIKDALAFSKEMEQEYISLRKWNHDIDNHLLSLSYLMDMKKYSDILEYQHSISKQS